MNVDAAALGRLEDRPGQDQAVGSDDRDFGVERSEFGLLFLVTQGLRRPDLDAKFVGPLMHCGLLVALAAPRWPRWLGVGANDVMPAIIDQLFVGFLNVNASWR